MAHFISLILASSLLAVLSQSRALFPFEQTQLTREYVASLPDEDSQLFAFGDQFGDLFAAVAVNTTKRCRYGPEDGKWPSEKAWQKLAKQLGSADTLIKTTPQAAVCYSPVKDDTRCRDLTKNWNSSYTHIDDPTEILSPIYQGLTCQPPSIHDSGSCTLGGYPSYVVKAGTVLDIQLAINFARNDGVRLVIKNTGHDYSGRSTGYGALSIWTHGLKDVQYFGNYVDESGYRGPAFKVGAGVQTFELYKAANEKGVVVVAGEEQTVGFVGGYIQGGGYSPLSSIYGMAADQVLGFELVTSIGEFLSANSTSNPDLFWALRGGGGGTFGVVTSVTIKAYKDMPVTTATWTLSSAKLGTTKFWAATQAFLDRIPDFADSGTYSSFTLTPTSTDITFKMHPFFAPNKTAQQTNTLLTPFLSRLTALNIPLSPSITEHSSFYPAWQSSFPASPPPSPHSALTSRLFPRSNFASETGRNITFSVLRTALEAGNPLSASHLAPTPPRAAPPDNAVNPAWRTAVLHAVTTRHWDARALPADILRARAELTNGTGRRWRDVSPGSGAYANEADRLEPEWQRSFWGEKYARLVGVKREWDPKDVFWAVNAVGSEGWAVESGDGLPGENGRLCRVEEEGVVGV